MPTTPTPNTSAPLDERVHDHREALTIVMAGAGRCDDIVSGGMTLDFGDGALGDGVLSIGTFGDDGARDDDGTLDPGADTDVTRAPTSILPGLLSDRGLKCDIALVDWSR